MVSVSPDVDREGGRRPELWRRPALHRLDSGGSRPNRHRGADPRRLPLCGATACRPRGSEQMSRLQPALELASRATVGPFAVAGGGEVVNLRHLSSVTARPTRWPLFEEGGVTRQRRSRPLRQRGKLDPCKYPAGPRCSWACKTSASSLPKLKRFPECSDHAGGVGISLAAGIEWASFSPHVRARSSSPGLSGPSVPLTRKLSVASTSKPWCCRRRAMPRAAEPVSSGTPSARVSKAAAGRPVVERRSSSQERRPGSSVASGSTSAPSCAWSTAT